MLELMKELQRSLKGNLIIYAARNFPIEVHISNSSFEAKIKHGNFAMWIFE